MLMHGPRAAICDGCVDLCAEIVAEERRKQALAERAQREAIEKEEARRERLREHISEAK
jgi:hypothetical protein